MKHELQLDYAAFDLWLYGEGMDNLADLECAKRMLAIVLDECVSVKQRDCIMKYYIEKMSISEIAEFYGVNKSSVSRAIRRGLDTAYSYLRFVSPLFINSPKCRKPLKNGKKPDTRGRKKENANAQ